MYDLTESQKNVARWLVEKVRSGVLREEFILAWTHDGILWDALDSANQKTAPEITKAKLDALEQNGLLRIHRREQTRIGGSTRNPSVRTSESSRTCTLTSKMFEAVDGDFAAPDTSFVKHLTPLADVTNLDSELKSRCLPILGAGSADPRLWDSAIRTAGVILEERLRDVGGISNKGRGGRDLVNDVFGQQGSLSGKVSNPSELIGYRDLYAGVVGVFRNPSAHRLVDPTPEQGGALITFIDLLLSRLECLR